MRVVLLKTILRFAIVGIAVELVACASAPPAPAPPPPAPPVITFEQKMAWILRLEDQRILRDPAPPVPPAPPPVKGGKPTAAVPAPPPIAAASPDLIALAGDAEARVRRRAALAIGRVGLPEGVAPLITLLADQEIEVRQMAAFALGLIGDKGAVDALLTALRDPSAILQGRAAEALGAIGDSRAAGPIGAMVATRMREGAVSGLAPDESTFPQEPPAEAVRLGVFALVRLRAYEPLAAAVLDAAGQPISRWWPVAYALQRLEDKRALRPLLTLARADGVYTRGFAIRGLGVLKDPAAVDVLLPQAEAWQGNLALAIASVRALGQIGSPKAEPTLMKLIETPRLDANLRLEAVTAIAGVKTKRIDPLLDLFADPWPPLRAAALRAVRDIDPENFMVVLSGLDPDSHWTVRSALASLLAGFQPDASLPRLTAMLSDADQRVVPAVLAALVTLKAPRVDQILRDHLTRDDPVIRMAASNGIGELKPQGGAAWLAEAYTFGLRDSTYIARAAALVALAKYGAPAAIPLLKGALGDKDWAVRVRAAALLAELDPSADPAMTMRPAPGRPQVDYTSPGLITPSVSPQVYIETDKGTIQLELAVLEAPITSENFMALARQGLFNGLPIHRVVPNFVVQDGDPRGDGEGGPGYTIRDELNQLPYLRGTVGMALDWKDTGGSQFFITHSPQPHLDARYTAFGRVIMGMEVVDRLQQGDVIQRIRIWDGKQMTAR
jgi:cyclophilin family peptidyl-prolyl cis-trans isomerase/HEAT repeat protein